MAVITPAPGLILASTPSSSSFAYSRRPLSYSRVSLRSSFLGTNGVPWKPIGMRITLGDRCKCHALGGGVQMNLFTRFVTILKSYASSFISIFEDPEKLLDQTVMDLDQELTKVRQAYAQSLASHKQIENKYKSAQQTAEHWYNRAKLAASKENDDLAREALNKRKTYAENAIALKAQLDQQSATIANIVSTVRLLEIKTQEAKSKKDTLKARAQSAKTAAKVTAMLGNVNPSGALAAFEKLEEKVWAMEAQAQALNQLVNDDLEGKFAQLESFSVEDDLASLKKDISGSLMRRELPPGRTNTMFSFQNMEIEAELNELRRCS